MRIAKFHGGRTLTLGLATAVAAAGLVATATPSLAVAPAATPTPSTGPSATAGTVLSVAGTGFKVGTTVKVATAGNSGVQFQTTACVSAPATPSAGTIYDASAVTVVTATKLVTTVPSMTITSGSSKAYYLCVYSTTGALLGQGTYTVYPKPTVTSISPSSGTVAGGATITVTGTGFTSKTTVTVGGTAATKTTVVDATTLTVIVPAHTATSTAKVVAKTEGGSSTNTVNYDYQNGITVSPQTGDGSAANTIDITGVGFSALDFTANANVLFTRGAYDPADDGGGAKTNGEAAVCTNIIVVSDTEIVCDAPDTASADYADGTDASADFVDGAYTVTIVSDDQMDADLTATGEFQTVVSSTATYTVAGF